MAEWTIKELERVVAEVEDIIDYANLGSRNAYKMIQSLKPRIDSNLDKWAQQAKENKGPAK